MNNVVVDNAKVMSKGQITIPKDFRIALGVTTGDRVTLVREGNRVYLMNAAIYAMQMLQNEMKGEAGQAGITNEEDVDALVREVRAEIESR